jgi:hypothetical protein
VGVVYIEPVRRYERGVCGAREDHDDENHDDTDHDNV